MESITNGLAQGDFHRLHIHYNGVMQDITPLLGGGSGSGSGIVTSATLPLSITNGVLSINTSAFCTAATAPLNLLNGLITIDLTNYSSTTQMNTAITTALTNYITSTALTNALAFYTDTTNLTTLLAAKQNTLTKRNTYIYIYVYKRTHCCVVIMCL